MRKRDIKILNDPIYGFVTISDDLIFQLINHPFFQRLRRIKQLGLTNLVYPGALHTRFHHAIGAMHLMSEAIEVIRSKGHEITNDEAQAVTIAILLHDIGHGPFSHSLENSIVHNITHEDISELFMNRLNKEFNGKLDLAIKIFKDEYKKKFLHQLVSSQLDIDRLDYLKRDSFYAGVSEGSISQDRIIKTLNVKNGELVVDEKGIYSVENFIVARRLMYWQVYLHKTVLSAENLLINILRRAKELADEKQELFCTPAFKLFLQNKFSKKDFQKDESLLNAFAELDDSDIIASVKVWTKHEDFVLSTLSTNMINRNLYKVEIEKNPIKESHINALKEKTLKRFKALNEHTVNYFVFSKAVANDAYRTDKININILSKSGVLTDITKASDQFNISTLSNTVKKYVLCYPKEV